MKDPVKVGVIGCGHVSGEYFESFGEHREIELWRARTLIRARALQGRGVQTPRVTRPTNSWPTPRSRSW